MSEFFVERQYWARWPRVLIVCKKRGRDEEGNLIAERRRYVPEGKTESQWKELCRKESARNGKLLNERDAAIVAQLEAQRSEASLRAERDGLLWAIEERDALIRDMAAELRYLNDGGISTDCMEHEVWMREMGIEVC